MKSADERPLPTHAECEVLQVLWRRGSATVREVHDELAPARGTGYTTTLKIMQMMLEKGLLSRAGSSRQHVYKARLRPSTTRRQILGPLIDRLFAGSTSALVQGALASRPVGAEELAAIRKLLDDYCEAQTQPQPQPQPQSEVEGEQP